MKRNYEYGNCWYLSRSALDETPFVEGIDYVGDVSICGSVNYTAITDNEGVGNVIGCFAV